MANICAVGLKKKIIKIVTYLPIRLSTGVIEPVAILLCGTN